MESVLFFGIGKEVKQMKLLQNTHNTFTEAINNRYSSQRV